MDAVGLRFGWLHIGFFHIELLHYYLVQDPGSSYSRPVIVDAHLDIAWNAISAGRGFLGEPAPGYVVSRSSLARGGVGLVFATLYTAPAHARRSMRTRFVYENAHEAGLMATAEVNYYKSCDLTLIGDRQQLQRYVRGWRRGRLAAVLLMEGADPVESPAQLGAWVDRGVRIIGPAWGRTRYSGGTHAPGGLTALGVQLLKAMRRGRDRAARGHARDQLLRAPPEVERPRDSRRHRPPRSAPRPRGRGSRTRGPGDRPRRRIRRKALRD
ncbi:MAG: hypothetical protein E6H97_10910, partial [Chloroflexi bacterium]